MADSNRAQVQDDGQAASPKTGLLAGKRGLVLGVANNRSIAWGIARSARQHGAELAFTYQGEALRKRVEPLARELDAAVVGHCDVTDPASIDAAFEATGRHFPDGIDFVVHCIAFSDKDELTGRYLETSEANFTKSLLISCYSFTAIAQRAEKLMRDGGSLLTLTYYGAEKWMPHYNVMGVAKAALEASVRYLAADLGEKNIRVNAILPGIVEGPRMTNVIKARAEQTGVSYKEMEKTYLDRVSMRRMVTADDVAGTILFLLSHAGRHISGQSLGVDGNVETL